MNSALVVVDVQEDFVEGGSLGCPGGRRLASKVLSHMSFQFHNYSYLIASQDWHFDPGPHWSLEPNMQDSFPRHCCAGEQGSMLVEPLHENLFDSIFRKGMFAASFSPFDGINKELYSLHEWLELKRINRLTFVGIATRFCVKAGVLESIARGYETTVLKGLVVDVPGPLEATTDALKEMELAGARIV